MKVLGVEATVVDELQRTPPPALHPAADEAQEETSPSLALAPDMCDPRDMERSALEAYLQSMEYFPTKGDLLEFTRRYNVPANGRIPREEIIRLCLRMIHDIPAGFAGLRASEKELPVTTRTGRTETRKTLESFFTGGKTTERVDSPSVKKIVSELRDSILRCHTAALMLAQARHADAELFTQAVNTCESPIAAHVQLLHNTIDFCKLETGKFALARTPFSLRDTVGEALKTVALPAHHKALELLYEVKPDVPDFLIGDPARLQQVLGHLLGNASKFTEQGEIVVTVQRRESRVHSPESSVQPPDSCLLHFSVRDTGMGIAPEKQRALLKALSQPAVSGSRKAGGIGFGLAIVRRLVELMGGQLWLHSEGDGGAIFHFTARLQTGPLPVTSLPVYLPAFHGRRILVVDDNATHRHMLQELLSSWQVQAQMAASAREALALLYKTEAAGTPFSVLLVDSHMPEMDGFSLIHHVKVAASVPSPTIIMLASVDPQKDGERCRELGVTAALAKPIKPAELLHALLSTLGPGEAPTPEEVLDRSELLALVDGDAALLRELIHLFWQSCPQLLFDLQQAMAAEDRQALLSTIHTLKGAVSNLAATRAWQALAVLEQCGSQGDFARAQGAFTSLVTEILQLKPVLAHLAKEREGVQ